MSPIVLKGGMQGRYKFIVRDGESMRVVRETPWMPNLILDAGLNRLGTGGIADWCQVGTSSAAVSAGQTSLVARIASTSVVNAYAQGANPTPPYYSWHRKVFRFAVGAAAGNISEVGVGWANIGSLWSRALTVDGGGIPTTITVLPSEVLDVVYELRVEMNTTDVIANVMIGGVLRTCTIRPSNVTVAPDPYVFDKGPWSGMVYALGAAYTGAIGPVTGQPTGFVNLGTVTNSYLPYANNSLERVMRTVYPLSVSPAVIEATTHITNLGEFQIGYSPPLVKSTTETLTLNFKASWARLP